MKPLIPFLARASASKHHHWLDALRAAMPSYDIRPFSELTETEKAAASVALVANPDPVHIAQLPNLVWIQSLWAGVERLIAELPDSKVAIVRLTDPELSHTMAEAVLAWCLYLHRDMPTYRHQQNQSKWQEQTFVPASQRKIGILGLGALGTASAKRLTLNSFQVLGWSRTPTLIEGVTCFDDESGLAEVLSAADIVVVLLPLTPQTNGLLNASKLNLMKCGARLINFGRGPIVNIPDLVQKLDEGNIAHAVLDVFDVEPLPAEDILWHHPSVTILPHVSAPTNKQTASAIVAHHLRRFFETGEIPPSVDRRTGY